MHIYIVQLIDLEFQEYELCKYWYYYYVLHVLTVGDQTSHQGGTPA